MIATTKKVREAEEHSKKLITMLQSSVKGEEVPIEMILKHNRNKDNNKPINENELKKMTLQELTQRNLNSVDALNRGFVQCMDQICDEYATKYGSECNVQ